MKRQSKRTKRPSSGPVRQRPRGTGASYVYDSLKSQILDLELQPGTFLDETELSRQFGVSRSPVREALIRLSAERLVKNLRNRTSIVAPFDVGELPAFFDAMMLLYRLSARLAAGRPDSQRVERLQAVHKEHEAALKRGDMKSMVRLNRAFHTGIAEMTGNGFIVDWMEGLLDQGQRVLRLYAHHLGDVLSSEVLQPHRDMLAAIAAGDAKRAEEAGRQDANTLIEEFQRNLANLPTAQLSLKVSSNGR
ncbi:MAG: GntR family transcriptional regulator [Hyphomicrobiaceae bacterium]